MNGSELQPGLFGAYPPVDLSGIAQKSNFSVASLFSPEVIIHLNKVYDLKLRFSFLLSDSPGGTSLCGQGRSVCGGCQAVRADAVGGGCSAWRCYKRCHTKKTNQQKKNQGTLFGYTQTKSHFPLLVSGCQSGGYDVVCGVCDDVFMFE